MESQDQAIAAVEKLQGTPLFAKPMRLAFARSKSDAANPSGDQPPPTLTFPSTLPTHTSRRPYYTQGAICGACGETRGRCVRVAGAHAAEGERCVSDLGFGAGDLGFGV